MIGRLLRQDSGAAAAEMAMVAPLLIFLMFGSMELGHYFYSQHVVVKAVRDGARFASRQSFANFTCPSTIASSVQTDTQNVTRTNTVLGNGTPRLAGWTQNSSVNVTLAQCIAPGTYGSFYGGGDVPVVQVEAIVPYTSLFKVIGFNSVGLQLRARQQAAVTGI